MYFDNAATSFPKPEPVYQAMDRFFRTAGANPGRSGHRMSIEAAAVVARARARLARLLGAPDPARVVWTSNCTEALNLALKGLLRPGDEVVTSSLEHNSVARPLRSLERAGVSVVRVPCPGGAFDLNPFLAAILPTTRLVAMVHASNVTGEVLPVAEVGAWCRARGVPLLIDAAQSAGVLPLNVDELAADLVAMPGHKALLGPPGTGALYIRSGLELTPLREGGTGSLSELDEQPGTMPDRYESGTQNSLGIAGLGAALEWIEATGRERIRQREAALTAQLWEELDRIPDVKLYGPPPSGERAAVVSLNLQGWEATDLAAVLDEAFDVQCRAGVHCAPWAHASLGTLPGGTLRLSPGYFNTEAEAEQVVRAFRRIAATGA